MRETLTDLLDTLGLLLVAAGVGCQAAGWFAASLDVAHGTAVAVYGLGVLAAGGVILFGSWLATRPAQPGVDR